MLDLHNFLVNVLVTDARNEAEIFIQRRKICSIKNLRQWTNNVSGLYLGLREAKDAVDAAEVILLADEKIRREAEGFVSGSTPWKVSHISSLDIRHVSNHKAEVTVRMAEVTDLANSGSEIVLVARLGDNGTWHVDSEYVVRPLHLF